jgi:hypothetical protein
MARQKKASSGNGASLPAALRWTAWKSGTDFTGSFGLRVPIADREKYFRRGWGTVTLLFPEDSGIGPLEVKITDSFWGTCSELRHESIKNRAQGRTVFFDTRD